MVVDTGTAITAISEKTVKITFFPTVALQMSLLKLKTYMGEAISVLPKSDIENNNICKQSIVAGEGKSADYLIVIG